jgi:hypothetical protein
MTIAFGRRRLIFTRDTGSRGGKSFDLAVAKNATDGELARLKSALTAAEARRNWEAGAILYGGLRPR